MKSTLIAMAIALSFGSLQLAADNHSEEEVVVTPAMVFPDNGMWQHAFDATKGASGERNAALARAVGFYRYMDDAGVDSNHVKTAVVVHGPAIYDIANATRYAAEYGDSVSNPNAELVAELMERGGEIWVCGAAAKARKVGDDDLLPGVKMAPAAMIAHADLQRRGFSVNPY